ncbi:hypothetical protein GH714_027852 [Hevea brasiliensis]|uniref:Uncharacterized protein n=1 Tax=Hevea brasiliensis TaxID=3981 RepID=A0A6A6KXQ8_HEVBR|nr:hypothetical protein GH714_027852 [Hevea brasiliensis]
MSTAPTSNAPTNTLVVVLSVLLVLAVYDFFVVEGVEDEFPDVEPLEALGLVDCVGGDAVDDEVTFEFDDTVVALETGGGGARNSVGGGGDSTAPGEAGGGTNSLGGDDFVEDLSRGGGDEWPDIGGDSFFAGKQKVQVDIEDRESVIIDNDEDKILDADAENCEAHSGYNNINDSFEDFTRNGMVKIGEGSAEHDLIKNIA